ncbi:uncharacterized protein LOC127749362 [Frankliniella occidentalis]|uniref:Uncharacterized protein LOC127749362 n=1 Tax=Frankliniella occidentalis TaxID=133901 RepID=A0A9C6U7I0_FRAOC|nr:uncharacterized protein LOC127749362 [Frankliniella occidentalis]
MKGRHTPQEYLASEGSSSASEEVAISPSKCSVRRPVRNLNKEFVNSPCKRSSEDIPQGKKLKNCEETEGVENVAVDVHAAFGQYVAAEMRRLDSDRAVRLLKHKIMKSILEVQSELEVEG